MNNAALTVGGLALGGGAVAAVINVFNYQPSIDPTKQLPPPSCEAVRSLKLPSIVGAPAKPIKVAAPSGLLESCGFTDLQTFPASGEEQKVRTLGGAWLVSLPEGSYSYRFAAGATQDAAFSEDGDLLVTPKAQESALHEELQRALANAQVAVDSRTKRLVHPHHSATVEYAVEFAATSSEATHFTGVKLCADPAGASQDSATCVDESMNLSEGAKFDESLLVDIHESGDLLLFISVELSTPASDATLIASKSSTYEVAESRRTFTQFVGAIWQWAIGVAAGLIALGGVGAYIKKIARARRDDEAKNQDVGEDDSAHDAAGDDSRDAPKKRAAGR